MDIMNKNTLVTVVLAGSMLTTPLFASNFFHKLMPNKKSVHSAANLHAKPKPTMKKEDQDYTDFSGSWAGNCSYSDRNDLPVTLTIENDDTYFIMDGKEIEIGPLHTETDADRLGTTFEHTSLEWSNDMSMLIIKNQLFGKMHSAYPNNESNPMMTVMDQVTLSLNNEQLLIKGQSLGFNDLEQVTGEFNNITCTLTKNDQQ